MTAKDYLNTYREYAEIEQEKREAYELEREKIDHIPTALNIPDGIQINSNRIHSRTEDHAIRLSERREAWQIAALNALEVRQEIFDMLIDLPIDESEVLIERYVDLKKWEDIALSLNMSHTNVHKLHRRGLQLIQDKIS